MIRRAPENPILTPAMVPASRPELEVVGAFNPAAVHAGGETVLLVRVAEAPRGVPEGEIAAAVWGPGGLEIRRFRRGASGVEAGSDPRCFTAGGQLYLTSISHLRIARSQGGIRFDFDPEPALAPATPLEAFGVEDPRLTLIDGVYHVTYSAVSAHGIATALAVSRDLVSFERRGILFAPNDRNTALFPERVDGRHLALHRPMPEGLGRPSIWLASSPDGIHWGRHRLVAGPRPGAWDDLKVGAGAVPFRVDGGWLAIYHGVTADPPTYSLGALLLDAGDPARVLARSREPILTPEAPYEKSGFFGDVVFSCGAVVQGDTVRVYYGAADGVTAVADASVDAILGSLV